MDFLAIPLYALAAGAWIYWRYLRPAHAAHNLDVDEVLLED